jgi:gluconolactonase
VFDIGGFFYLHSPNTNRMRSIFRLLILLTVVTACGKKEVRTTGSIERTDPALNELINEDAQIEILAEGYKWSEGPVWVESQHMLLFSDVPRNTIFKWTEENGAEVYMMPSGYTGSEPPKMREPGSNGLALDTEGNLILCQHGDRRVARMNASLDAPKPDFVTIADRWDNKRFNSPNDVVVSRGGDFYFTDPPYGLPKQENDSTRETKFQGVYKVSKDGKVTLLVDSITRPNGIALTPDEKTLIVANSDPAKPNWYAFDLLENDSVTNARIFYNTSKEAATEKGVPDGFRIDKKGNMFATGPGGIWIFNPQGKVIGKLKLPEPTANCALADDDKTLYITSNMYLLRLKMR